MLSSTTVEGQHKNVIFGFVVVKPHALDHLWMAFSHTAFHQSFFIFLFIFWMHFAGLMLMIFTCWPADFRHASFVIKIYLPFIIIFIRITTQTYSILIHLSTYNIDLPIQKQQSPSTTIISSHNEISHY